VILVIFINVRVFLYLVFMEVDRVAGASNSIVISYYIFISGEKEMRRDEKGTATVHTCV